MKIERIAAIILVLNALAFIVFGAQWLLNPIKMSGPLGIVLSNADAITDAQAVYGGLELGLGAFLILCALKQQMRLAGLFAATFSLAGLGLARILGILTVSSPITGATTQLVTTDVIGIAVNTIALIVFARKQN